MNMQIAGVKFSLSCRQPVTLNDPEQKYRPFFVNTGTAIDSIDINLELKNLPDTGKMTRIFDSLQSWSLFLDGDDYFFEYKPPSFNEPFWIARLQSTSERATVHCGEALINRNGCNPAVTNPLCYPLDQLLLMYILARREGGLIHAAGMRLDNRGFVFPGRSGAGKTTLSRLLLWHNNIGMLSDDRIIIRRIDNAFRIFGTPWAGEAGIAGNENSPLYGIFFLHHDSGNRIREIKPAAALKKLLPVVSIPWYDEKTMSDILFFCGDLVSHVPAYEFYFKPDNEAVHFLEKFISS
ncbi:MAG: hypothetical protein AB1632_12360 [Nitrospirota bacterium]